MECSWSLQEAQARNPVPLQSVLAQVRQGTVAMLPAQSACRRRIGFRSPPLPRVAIGRRDSHAQFEPSSWCGTPLSLCLIAGCRVGNRSPAGSQDHRSQACLGTKQYLRSGRLCPWRYSNPIPTLVLAGYLNLSQAWLPLIWLPLAWLPLASLLQQAVVLGWCLHVLLQLPPFALLLPQ